MKFICPYSAIEYSVSGISAPLRQRLPHPILASSYRHVYANRQKLPIHLVLIRSLLESSLVIFDAALIEDSSLPDWRKLQCVDWLNANLDFMQSHKQEFPHLRISSEMNTAHVGEWIEQCKISLTIIQHKERNLKDAIYRANMPFNDMVRLIRQNDHQSSRLIQRIMQNNRDFAALLLTVGLEEPKEYYLLRNLEPAIIEALESKNHILYHTLCGLREEQNKQLNALKLDLPEEHKHSSLAEFLKAKKK